MLSEILPQFQEFLVSQGLVKEKSVSFYAYWVSKFLDFSLPISLFEFIDIEEKLSELLGVKVDFVSRRALKPYIGKHILEEVQMI